ncbi:MAG: hypothetical protein Q8L88_13955 [Bacteroidota bacterium]|nr:hypothetical protein [Bacteroidota bacterium]
MSRPIETLDITLLRNNKNEFVIRCQRIISIIVWRYTANGMFALTNVEDIKQSVTLELINRLPLIEKNYNGQVLLTTYLSVVIKNICLRIHETESSDNTPLSFNELWKLNKKNIDGGMVSDENADNDILLSNELDRFTLALDLFYVRRFKILVFLKVYFSIPVTSEDLKGCFRNITRKDLEHLLDVFNEQHQSTIEFANFGLLTVMMNKYERTSTPEESVRRLAHRYIQKLIKLMNGKTPSRAHTKDSLQVLLERYSELHTQND